MPSDFCLYSLLKRHLPWQADKIALSWDSGQYTFSQLLTETHSLALGLKDLGIKQGERMAILANNIPGYLPLLLASSVVGTINVLLNRRLSQGELSYILKDTAPKFIFTDQDNLPLAREISGGKITILPLDPADIKKTGREKIIPVSSQLPFIIIHTAAMQGTPMGAVLNQNNLIAANMQLIARVHLTTRDCHLNILPFYHIMGLNLALATLQVAGHNVLLKSFAPQKAVQLIKQHQVTILGSFPPILKNILDQTADPNKDLSSLRAVLGVESKETAHALQTNTTATFFPVYGQTETSGLISFSPFQDAPGSAGKPGELTLLKIVDDQDRELETDQTGEIVIQGPLVFQGYWNRPEETRYTFRNNWHHTGDLGKMNKNGFLYFAGRKPEKELIKSGGENIFPSEVETVIMQLPEIQEVCVIGVPDEKFGEGIKAVCVLKKDKKILEQEIIDFVASRIAAYKKPRYIQFVSLLPKTREGKIDRQQVKNRFGQP